MVPASSVHLTCLCGSISEPGSLLSDQNTPVYAEMCHCNTCRYTTGALNVPFSPLASSPSATTLEKLQSYRSSDIVTRYFCPTCGCFCIFYTAPRNMWYFVSGAIERNPDIRTEAPAGRCNIFKVMRHAHILDTEDGGLAPFLLQLGDRSVPTWAGIPAPFSARQDSFDLPHANILSLLGASSEHPSQQPDKNSYLTARCHCGGVNLLIKRANHTTEKSSRCTYSDATKYSTYLCACRSCRLSTGISLFPWTLVNVENVFNGKKSIPSPDTNIPDSLVPITFGLATSASDANPGLSLKHYWSSPDTCRSFCDNCGAAVSYWCAKRPDELDIAVGILRSEDGSLARRWLGWEWGRCSFPEESTDTELCEAWSRAPELIRESIHS